jgi:hypothetical protein
LYARVPACRPVSAIPWSQKSSSTRSTKRSIRPRLCSPVPGASCRGALRPGSSSGFSELLPSPGGVVAEWPLLPGASWWRPVWAGASPAPRAPVGCVWIPARCVRGARL